MPCAPPAHLLRPQKKGEKNKTESIALLVRGCQLIAPQISSTDTKPFYLLDFRGWRKFLRNVLPAIESRRTLESVISEKILQ